jgi:hypothetical protein
MMSEEVGEGKEPRVHVAYLAFGSTAWLCVDMGTSLGLPCGFVMELQHSMDQYEPRVGFVLVNE